jgi:hypothetical protein
MGTGSFPGVKRPGRGADQPPLQAPSSRKSRAIPLPPPLGLRVCYRVPLPLPFYVQCANKTRDYGILLNQKKFVLL